MSNSTENPFVFPDPMAANPERCGVSDLCEKGITLRDWFAGQALAGKCGWEDAIGVESKKLADEAYVIADAMLKRREKK